MMENPPFLNPPATCPWVSSQPRTCKFKKTPPKTNDENNNVRSPRVTRFMFRQDLQACALPRSTTSPHTNWLSPSSTGVPALPRTEMYRSMGFYAHSGHFHTYYQSTKRALLEEYCNGYQNIPAVLPQHRPIEVIDITGDSPPPTPRVDARPSLPFDLKIKKEEEEKENRKSGGAEEGKSPKPSVRIRPKTDLLGAANDDEGCKPKDTTRRPVGVVISKKSAGYVARLL